MSTKNNETLIFMKFIKTGGTTIVKHMQDCLGDAIGGFDEKGDFKVIQGHDIRYGTHSLYKNYKYMTIIREPTAWYLSCYNHDRARRIATGRFKVVEFNEWYNEQHPNTVSPVGAKRNKMYAYAKRLYAGKVKEALDACWFVGITSRIDKQLYVICDCLGISCNYKHRERETGTLHNYDENLFVKKHQTLTHELRKKIYDENSLDVELYEYALKRNKECMIQVG